MICESEQYHKKIKCASVLDRKIKHPQESQQFVITKISGIVLLQYKFCLNSVFGPNGCKTTQVSTANFFVPNTNVGSDVSLPRSPIVIQRWEMLPSVTKWQEANFLIGKRSKNSKLDSHTRPMQSDFGCSRQQRLDSICTNY